MELNRRRHLRKIPDESTFIQIERDEVGTVLNVSEGGLSFRSFAPVPDYGPVYFWLAFDLRVRVEAMGELTWADKSRKVGGLRFTQLSPSGREQLRRWLSRLPAEGAIEEEPVLQVVARGAVKETKAGRVDRVAKFVSKARPRNSILSLSLQSSETEELKPSPLPPAAIGSPAELVPLQRFLSVKRKQLFRGMVLGVCISAAAGIAAFKYWNSHSHRVESKPTVMQSPVPKNDVPAPMAAPDLQPESSRSPSHAGIFSTNVRNSGKAPDRSTSRAVADTYPLPRSNAAGANAMKPSALALNSQQPGGKSSPNKKPMTRAQLWAAVQAGNSQAAVELAELYIKGEGVAQNCQQARVLLLMASEKRNTAAIKRLHELDQDPTTCP